MHPAAVLRSPAQAERFGGAMASHGRVLVVGASHHHDHARGAYGTRAGAAYVFEPDGGGAWAETAALGPPVSDDDVYDLYYGASVALAAGSGEADGGGGGDESEWLQLAVGALGVRSSAPRIYLYSRGEGGGGGGAGAWVLRQTLHPAGAAGSAEKRHWSAAMPSRQTAARWPWLAAEACGPQPVADARCRYPAPPRA